MTDNQRPRVEFPGDAAARIIAETQAQINELLRSTDPKERAIAQELQVVLNKRTGR